ncbi:hypothetical protein [Bacillus safensis]|uniref:hypothetical protein n=1 Tax=Bacillus safensis TaxID=561879 RepID=UPI003C1BD718
MIEIDKILNHVLPKGAKLLEYGQLDSKIPMRIKMTTSLYEHLEFQYHVYDDEEFPYELPWIDIEGCGYGWLWNTTDQENWHTVLAKNIFNGLDNLADYEEKTLYFNYTLENHLCFHFITLDEYRKDFIIKMSNEEMFPF